MVKITLTNGEVKKFNLKDFASERKMRATWYSMQGEPKYENKKLRITTADGVTDYPIKDIADCIVDDALYVKGTVSAVRPEPEPEDKQPDDLTEKILNGVERIKRERGEKFINAVRDRGVEPNMDDPLFRKALETAQNDSSDFKFPIYVNLYCMARGK